jgi:hypothetical protein
MNRGVVRAEVQLNFAAFLKAVEEEEDQRKDHPEADAQPVLQMDGFKQPGTQEDEKDGEVDA